MARVGLGRLEYLMENLKRELDMSSSSMTGLGRPVVSLAGTGATKQLTGADSGCIIRMGGDDASVVTLPALQAGLHFRFVAVTASLAHQINGGASKIQGGFHHNTNDGTLDRVVVTNRSSIALHGGNTMIGDTLEFWCDGVNWYVSGIINDLATLG